MRINLWKAILVAVCVLAITGVSQTGAGDLAKEEQVAAAPPGPDGPMMGKGQPELTPAQMDHILAEIKEKNPQEANELTQLRQKDPNAFRNELRNRMREQFMSRMLEQKGAQQGGPAGQPNAMAGPGAPRVAVAVVVGGVRAPRALRHRPPLPGQARAPRHQVPARYLPDDRYLALPGVL